MLHLSEHAAYGRIEAARAGRRFPLILERLADGTLTLTASPPVVRPLAPERYKVQFTMSRDMHDTLRRAQELLRHTIPTGDPAAIFERARDEGRCAFVGTNGRCTGRGFIEFHHVVPFAAGGETTTQSLELRCRAHNGHEAQLYFGPSTVREEVAVFDP